MSEPGVEDEAAATESGAVTGGSGAHVVSLSRPVVLPETFDGTRNWDEWVFHFQNVAAVNSWNDGEKLKWLRVRLTGRAQKALLRLPESSRETYEATRAALKARFDPESRQTRYQAEFETRRKKTNEGWADFADDLKTLVDKGYPSLQDEAREQLAINHFLQQLTQSRVAFSVKQKRPKTLDDAVAATLEMELYVTGTTPVGVASTQPLEEATVCPVSELSKVDKLTQVVEQLAEQVERLQRDTRPRRRRGFTGECWKCREHGHIAHNCPQNHSITAGKLATSSAVDQPLEDKPSEVQTSDTVMYGYPHGWLPPVWLSQQRGYISAVGHWSSCDFASEGHLVTGCSQEPTRPDAVVGNEAS